ncbi:MAG: ferritin-like domain-containing protein [Chloroflexi bacterium]|nr:ferritin-like domain-containing protein [Chloroflexota bacterium]
MAQKMKNLEDLFVDTLQDLYDAEHQLVKALPKMAEQANSKELKQGFKEHLDVTNRQIERVEQIFKELKMEAKGKRCKGMEGLIKEGDEMIQEAGDPMVKDAALIASAQKIEHYEISGYGTARAYAQALGHQNIARVLDQIANEEGQADKKLTALAEGHINMQARK